MPPHLSKLLGGLTNSLSHSRFLFYNLPVNPCVHSTSHSHKYSICLGINLLSLLTSNHETLVLFQLIHIKTFGILTLIDLTLTLLLIAYILRVFLVYWLFSFLECLNKFLAFSHQMTSYHSLLSELRKEFWDHISAIWTSFLAWCS